MGDDGTSSSFFSDGSFNGFFFNKPIKAEILKKNKKIR
jgi:hypothetical protein